MVAKDKSVDEKIEQIKIDRYRQYMEHLKQFEQLEYAVI